MTPTDAELAELLAAAEKATERPWVAWWTAATGSNDWAGKAVVAGPPQRFVGRMPAYSQEDANYLTLACNIAPRLAEEVQRLRADLAAAHEYQAAASAAACEVNNMHVAEIAKLREENERLKAAMPAPEKRRSRLPPGNKRKLGETP